MCHRINTPAHTVIRHWDRASVALLCLLVFTEVVCAAPPVQPVEPDYTKGETLVMDGRGKLNYWALGPTGAFGNIWAQSGIMQGNQTANTRMIQIRSVTEGTPADGVLREGDVIVGIGHAKFDSDARKALSSAITEAEKKENGGRLVLNIWRDGKTLPVTIQLPVIGAFSDTSPWACEKTQALIDVACRDILKRGLFDDKGRAKGGIPTLLEALGLLATGEAKYLPVVQPYARAIGRPDLLLDIESSSSWSWSYTAVLLTEYYLASGDEYVLPAIREYATKIAMGRSGVGTWSHGMANPSENGGRLYGHASAYGAMNQCSITCALALVLSQKCGVDNPEVAKAVELATKFLRWYVDKGGIPYGDHAPAENGHDDNGRNSQAAVLYDLVGDQETARYFTRMAVASYRNREGGHTGHFFAWQWGALGAARGGDEAAQSFVRNTRWFTELERRPGGGSVYQFQLAGYDHGKYSNWSTTGSRLLQHCLPRQKLYITGKGGSSIAPITGEELEQLVADGAFDPTPLTVAQLLDSLGSWSPIVRSQAAQELGKRDENVVEQLIAMLDSPNRYARYGACAGLRYAGRQSQEAVARVVKILDEGDDLTLRYFACMALRPSRIWHGPPTRTWQPVDNGLASQGGQARIAIPALLKQATKYEPTKDPMRKLQAEVAETLFYGGNVRPYQGYFPNGKGMENVDRTLLIPAIKSLLINPNGAARTAASSTFDDLSEQDLQQLWGDIYYAGKYQAPSGVMFGGGVRARSIAIMADHHIKEGMDVGIDWTFRTAGWGLSGRLSQGVPALLPFGKHLEPRLTEIDHIIKAHATGKSAHARRSVGSYTEAFEKLKAELPQDKPPLISIQSSIDQTPDPTEHRDGQ